MGDDVNPGRPMIAGWVIAAGITVFNVALIVGVIAFCSRAPREFSPLPDSEPLPRVLGTSRPRGTGTAEHATVNETP